MMGPDLQMRGMEGFDHSLGGIIPRSTEDIFEKIHQTEGIEFTVQVSYLEVYRETVKDLLDATKTNLSVREGKDHSFYVEGLTEEYVTDAEEVLDALKRGDENRAVAATKMNAVSSRSHSVFMMKVNQRRIDDGSTKTGQLNLVDLAGSEKIQKTGASGQTLEEAKMINKSLSALSSVIKALADGKGHTPFRDSKLTLILRNSLGGNTKTSLLLAASPHPDNVAETISTIRFGERAKKIKTKVKANTQRSAAQLQQIVDRLQDELEKTRAYVKLLEDKLGESGIALPSQPSKADVADIDAVSGGNLSVGETELEMAVMVEQLKDSEEARMVLLREVETAQQDAREAEAEMQRAQDALMPAQIRLEDALKAKESVEHGMEELRRQLLAEKKSSREKIKAEEARSEAKKQQIALAIKSLKEKVEQEKKAEKERTMAVFQQMKRKSEEQLAEAQQQWQQLSGLEAAEKQQAAVDLVVEQERKRSEAVVTEITAERDRLAEQAEQAERQAKEFEDRLSDATEQLDVEVQARKDAVEDARIGYQEQKEEQEREHTRALDALRAEKDAELAEKQGEMEKALAEMEKKLAETKLEWHRSLEDGGLRDSMSGRTRQAKVVKPQQRTIVGRGSTSQPEPEPEQSSEMKPPEGACLKQRTVGTWPSRYIKIEASGLTVFESKRKAEQNLQARGSSIRSLLNCKVTAGYHEFTFGGRWYKLTIFREDLEPPEQNYCFQKESDRDRFLTACQNIAEGRDWSVNGTTTRASARKLRTAARAAMAGRAFSTMGAGDTNAHSSAGGSPGGVEAADDSSVNDGSASDQARGSLSCRMSIEARAQEDGGEASDTDWAGERSFYRLAEERNKYKLMGVVVNDTEKLLEYVGSWMLTGEWYQPPPQTISAGMTAAFGLLGTQGFTGESGPYGCVIYRADGIEVIIAYQNSFGGQKIAGSVFTTGRLRMPDGGVDPAAMEECTRDLLRMNSQLNAEDGCHISWVPPPFATKREGREAPRAQWVLSDEPSVVLRQLRPLLERAGRSMLVCIENCTPYPLQLDDQHLYSGMWRTMPPSLIKAGELQLPTVAVFATESTGAGTDAQITLTVDIPMLDGSTSTKAEHGPVDAACESGGPDERNETGGGSAQTETAATAAKTGGARRTTVVLRWANPKLMQRKSVEVKTSFQHSSASSGAAGETNAVIYWDEPEQRDTSRVTFRVVLERDAEEIDYTPLSSSSDPSTLEKYRERFTPIPTLEPLDGSALSQLQLTPTSAPAEEGVPPDVSAEEVRSEHAWNPDCPRCEEMESMCGICLSRANASS